MGKTKSGAEEWSRTTRWLHFMLAITVTAQLFLSLIMEEPGEGEGLEKWAFIAHELFGLAALSIVILKWFWLMGGRDGGIRRILPWNRAELLYVLEDVKGLILGKLPAGGPQPGLPGLIQGLGFLSVTYQGLTGFAIFMVIPPEGKLPESFEFLLEMHEAGGELVWIYWYIHVGMALFHTLCRHALLRQISPFHH